MGQHLLDGVGTEAPAWGPCEASGLGNNPSYLVVGKDGRLLHRYAGKLTEGTAGFDALAAAIEGALGG